MSFFLSSLYTSPVSLYYSDLNHFFLGCAFVHNVCPRFNLSIIFIFIFNVTHFLLILDIVLFNGFSCCISTQSSAVNCCCYSFSSYNRSSKTHTTARPHRIHLIDVHVSCRKMYDTTQTHTLFHHLIMEIWWHRMMSFRIERVVHWSHSFIAIWVSISIYRFICLFRSYGALRLLHIAHSSSSPLLLLCFEHLWLALKTRIDVFCCCFGFVLEPLLIYPMVAMNIEHDEQQAPIAAKKCLDTDMEK